MKRFLARVLSVMMIFTIIPSFSLTAFAEDVTTDYDLYVGGEQFTSDKLIIEDANDGTATYDPATNTLTLNGFTYEGAGYKDATIYNDGTDNLNLELVGENGVTKMGATIGSSCGVYAYSGDISVEKRSNPI